MKVFIRSIKGSDCSSIVNKIDYLSTEEYNKTVIYKIDVSIEENSQFSGSYDSSFKSASAGYPAQSIINNVFTTQILIVNNQSITIPPGFYSLENLFAIINQQSIAISLIKNEENAYHTKTSTTFNFTNAREIQEILGFDSSQESASAGYKAVVSSESISANPANITRGLNVIQLYSSITNSDSDIPIVTIKIDNPLESFHQSYETNINVKNSVLNYIDVHFRDIAGNLITLNGNITINFYFKTFDEVIEQIFESNNNRFNITSQITNLDNGHYSHKLSRPINLTNSKIVNANFLTNGSIYNLSTDQTVTIDGIPFIVQKGCYSLEEILSVMNNLTGAVFSYINSGENCYKIQIDNISSIKFETPELANMLGFDCDLIESSNIVEKYQLTSNNNVFKLTVNSGSWILTVEPGIYTEQQFFNKLQEAIYPYDSSISILLHEHYVEFVNSSGLIIDEISSTESVYNNRLEQYHWFQGFNYKNSNTTNFTIARYNCFYLKTTGTDNRYLENIYFAYHNNIREYGLKAIFSNGTSKSYDLRKFPFDTYMYIGDVLITLYDELLSDHFTYKNLIAEGNFKYRRIEFNSKDGVSVYFTGAYSFIEYLNLPTSASTKFDGVCYNRYVGILKTKGETIGFRCTYDNKWYDLVIDNNYNLAKLCYIIRDWITSKIQKILNVKTGHSYSYYYCVFRGLFVKSNLLENCEWIQYRGSLIDKQILTGFHTEQQKPVDMIVYANYINTFDIDLGYTCCDELQKCIENRLEEYNYNFQVNPHYHSYLDSSSCVRLESNFFIPLFTIPGINYLDYDNSENYYHVRIFSNGYNKYSFNSTVTLTTSIDGFETTFIIQTGYYNQASLFKTINNFIVNQGLYFIKRSTYYALVKNNKNITISGTICDYVNFVNTSSEIRVFYDDKAVLDLSSICSNYPCNITNGFNLINVFSNLCDTRKNNDNYLTSFVISKSNGINVSNAGIKNNYSNSNSTLDRYISDSNINQIDYYFERENGEPFSFNGTIVANIEIVSE